MMEGRIRSRNNVLVSKEEMEVRNTGVGWDEDEHGEGNGGLGNPWCRRWDMMA